MNAGTQPAGATGNTGHPADPPNAANRGRVHHAGPLAALHLAGSLERTRRANAQTLNDGRALMRHLAFVLGALLAALLLVHWKACEAAMCLAPAARFSPPGGWRRWLRLQLRAARLYWPRRRVDRLRRRYDQMLDRIEHAEFHFTEPSLSLRLDMAQTRLDMDRAVLRLRRLERALL